MLPIAPPSGLVLGVDVGWSETKKTTGACALRWSADTVTFDLRRLPTALDERREGLLALIGRDEVLAVGLDGPMRGGLDRIGIYRDAEMILTRGFQHIGKPGQSSSGNGKKLNDAANDVALLVLQTGKLAAAKHRARIHDKAIVEAFPTTFLGVMLDEGTPPAHGARSDAYFMHLLGPNSMAPRVPDSDRLLGLLARLLPGRVLGAGHLGDVTDHEERAAIVCALSALCVAVRSYVGVGDPQNGYIILPPRSEPGLPGLQPWAWRVIESNRPSGRLASVIEE